MSTRSRSGSSVGHGESSAMSRSSQHTVTSSEEYTQLCTPITEAHELEPPISPLSVGSTPLIASTLHSEPGLVVVESESSEIDPDAEEMDMLLPPLTPKSILKNPSRNGSFASVSTPGDDTPPIPWGIRGTPGASPRSMTPVSIRSNRRPVTPPRSRSRSRSGSTSTSISHSPKRTTNNYGYAPKRALPRPPPENVPDSPESEFNSQASHDGLQSEQDGEEGQDDEDEMIPPVPAITAQKLRAAILAANSRHLADGTSVAPPALPRSHSGPVRLVPLSGQKQSLGIPRSSSGPIPSLMSMRSRRPTLASGVVPRDVRNRDQPRGDFTPSTTSHESEDGHDFPSEDSSQGHGHDNDHELDTSMIKTPLVDAGLNERLRRLMMSPSHSPSASHGPSSGKRSAGMHPAMRTGSANGNGSVSGNLINGKGAVGSLKSSSSVSSIRSVERGGWV